MRRAFGMAGTMWSAIVALASGALCAFDVAMALGLDYRNFKDPRHHDDLVDALLNSSPAPLIHLALFVGSLVLFMRFRSRRALSFERLDDVPI